MLHLSLAGNLLKAIGGAPRLYHRDIIPNYPSYLLFRTPRLPLQLRPMTKPNLDTFIKVRTCDPGFLILGTVRAKHEYTGGKT